MKTAPTDLTAPPRSSTPSPPPAAVKHFGEVERAVTELGTLPGQAVMYLTPEDAADLRKRAVELRKSLKAWTARLDAEAPKGSERENQNIFTRPERRTAILLGVTDRVWVPAGKP